ncbi:hypothetical protein [Wolbachia endosymbiont (group A) of Agelastica alni]|uniref:hypothetical protein n=1 Tax=Wolbachia endosymbiont (group A) of Agelastica alni TaxID=3066130 RepID=UPI00333E49C1
MSNYMSIQNSKTRVIKNELQTTGSVRANDQSVEDVKITNDHAFYKLICEKQAHGDVSVEQFNSLYYEISEKMIKKPFTIQEINDFCNEKGIPLFTTDELLTLVPKEDTKCYVNYETNSVKTHDHGYMADQINIKASYIRADSVNHQDCQNYVVDSDAYYKFIYKKMVEGSIRSWVLENLDGSKSSEDSMREYLKNSSYDQELKAWLRDNPEGNLKGWLSDPANKGYTNVEYHVLYEKISEKLVHTSMNIDQIKEIYNKHDITPPTDSEFGGIKKVQEETRSSEHYEQKTGLTFQGRINLNVTDDNADNKFNLNIDLFQDKSFEDLTDQNNDGVINNEGLLKSLEETVKTFNEVFGIKKDNNPLLTHGNVANFRLFLFENKESYQKYLSGGHDVHIPGGGAAESSDNNYISNMYSHAENARNNGDFTHDGKIDHNDYNYVIKHEFVHALTFYLTSKLDLGKVLMEGLAEYVTHLTEGEKPADFAKLVSEEYKEHTLEEIVKGAIDPYQTGAAVIAYIEETYPNFIDNLLYAATEDRKTLNGRFYFKEMMQKIYQSEAEKIQKGEGFSNWVKTHSSTEDNTIESDHIQSDQPVVDHEEDEVQSKGQVSEDKAATSSFRGLEAPKKPVIHEHNEEKIILKDTILKIEKSYEQDSEGKHKANVTINYNDVKALYDRAEGAEKQSVLDFWNKLHTSDYKVGALPEDKYYFEKGKFVIHDSGTKKLIVLPEDKVSIKIMKDGNHYDLAISNNDNGKVISSITKIDNLNYELLSDSNSFSLETQDSTIFSGQHNEYNLYLENGFAKMFDCASDHIYHDHNSTYIYS